LENSECGEDLTRNGRRTYMSGMFGMSGEDAECTKERYVRVAAIITAAIDGTKNNCLRDIRNPSLPPSVAKERTYQVERA
jgi:hypothetical protein